MLEVRADLDPIRVRERSLRRAVGAAGVPGGFGEFLLLLTLCQRTEVFVDALIFEEGGVKLLKSLQCVPMVNNCH